MIAAPSLAAFTGIPGIGPANPPPIQARPPAVTTAPFNPFKPSAPGPQPGQAAPRGSLLDLTA